MGNFEKLSVLVIVVIIVMILVVALYTWSNGDDVVGDSPEMAATQEYDSGMGSVDPLPVGETPSGRAGGEALPLFPPAQLDPPPAIQPSAPVPAPIPDRAPAPAPQERGFVWHEVKGGETLGDISRQHLGSVSKWPEIVKMNPGLEPERLRPGQKIKVPTSVAVADGGDARGSGSSTPREANASSSSGGSAIAGKEYTVRRGDTLEKISAKVYGTKTRWPEIWIENLNRLEDPSDIFEGMVLQLPAK